MLLDLALASLALCPRTLRVSVHAVRATSTASLNPNAYAAATGPLTRLPCPVARRCESLTAMVMDDDAEQPTHTLDLRQPAGRQRPGPGAGGAKDFGRDPRPFLSELPTEEELGVNHWDHLDTEGPQPSPSEDGGGAACCVAGEGVRLRQLHALRSVAQLQLALQHADAEGGRPVVLKFFSPHCITCKSIKLKFERTVKATSNAIDFYEVDRVQALAFCNQCGVRYLPAAHIYHKGELVRTMALGARTYAAFNGLVNEMAESWMRANKAPAGSESTPAPGVS
mmetsp:Transcript_3621/g.7643  ORF Transcript_3621/g.7643 Transcript_3621/m.7643 type:complete len:282 (-) Transcript_3621:230-1075(-)